MQAAPKKQSNLTKLKSYKSLLKLWEGAKKVRKQLATYGWKELKRLYLRRKYQHTNTQPKRQNA